MDSFLAKGSRARGITSTLHLNKIQRTVAWDLHRNDETETYRSAQLLGCNFLHTRKTDFKQKKK